MYRIFASNCKVKWRYITSFKKGEMSRFNAPFDIKEAIKETLGFKKTRYKDYKFVRLIANSNNKINGIQITFEY